MITHSMKKLWFLFGVVFFFTISCGGPAHFNRSFGVARAFEDYQVMPEYKYYISGNTYKPTAVVGLDRAIALESPHFQAVEPDQEQLKQWVQRMREQPGAEYNIEPNGAVIRNDQGKQIGVWYSVWTLPLLTVRSERVISISEPMTVFPASNRNRGNNGHDWFD